MECGHAIVANGIWDAPKTVSPGVLYDVWHSTFSGSYSPEDLPESLSVTQGIRKNVDIFVSLTP